VRDRPSPAILEIEIANRSTKRTITFDPPPEASLAGLAIAPGKAGTHVAYVPARDGWVWMYDITLLGPESSSQASLITRFIPGGTSPTADLSIAGGNVTRALPTFLAQYNHGQVIIINDKIVYVYNVTDEGRPISISSYQAYSFGIPDTKGFAFASERAFLVTQDDEGGRDNARVMGVEYDHDLGFGFCK
jgi:hypothetical protein